MVYRWETLATDRRISQYFSTQRVSRGPRAWWGDWRILSGSHRSSLYMVRGDTNENTIMMGDHEEGFGFIRNVTIDQHLLTRNRQFDLIEVIEAHPELLGIGIDEKQVSWSWVIHSRSLDAPASRCMTTSD